MRRTLNTNTANERLTQMKKYFVSGIATLFPIIITCVVITFFIKFITKPFIACVQEFLIYCNFLPNGIWIFSQKAILPLTSTFVVLFLLVASIFFLGVLAQYFSPHPFLALCDKTLRSIPIFRKIYSACKDFIDAFFHDRSNAFESVVIVPYPTENDEALGLVTGHSVIGSEEFVSVLIPGSPNPTIGYVLFLKKEVIKYTDIRIEDAMKYIVSCGVTKNFSINIFSTNKT